MTIDKGKRKFLKGSLSTIAAMTAMQMFPPSIQKALAIAANNKTGTIKDVEHVVIFMQENRSFDNYFGTFPGVRGFGDRFTIPLPNNLNVWQQSDGKGNVILPYRLDQDQGNAQRVAGTPHSWVDARNAWDKGRMTHWPQYKQPQSMSYFGEQELQFQFALANAFTLCDAYYCSLHGGTNSNRLFHMTGTNGATTSTGKVVVNNVFDELNTDTDLNYAYDWTTYPERLEANGVSWKVYQNLPDNFTDNPLAGFRQYREANILSGKPVYNDVDFDDNPAYDPATDSKGLYKGIANTMPDGGFLASFKQDILAGNLPQVSWIIAPADYSEHPGPSSPVQGAWYTQEILDALTENPDVWSKTVLFVNFDENDGFFDHMPPPCAPSLDENDEPIGKSTLSQEQLSYEYYTHPIVDGTRMPPQDKDCYGPGPRVPMFVISPWSRGGWVNSQQFDHTSVLRFLEARFGVREGNISPFRRAVFGDLTSAFNFTNPNVDPLPTLEGRSTKEYADTLRQAQEALLKIPVPAEQDFPVQQAGIKPSRALPYELHTSARTYAQAQIVSLIFANTGSQAAVFHVYDKLHLKRVPRRYVVEAGKQLDDVWVLDNADAGAYDLWVLGPNGYHRAFAGELTPGHADPEIRVCYDITYGKVLVTLMNSSDRPCAFNVTAKAYRKDGPWTATVASGSQHEYAWELEDSGNWYDFEVTCEELPAFYRRFAGRVEIGKDSITDPAFGLL
ncbi:phosphocholine-specific phospholipase C [Serratia oryzae]|uniref:phosphocholine-specific phospholipase C n=1 Tax=Serratia oryzae TaxID=2034155 RepID=UPI0012E31657|nr:phospholipase C, phosphocholine-specific [Serratia oryzae]